MQITYFNAAQMFYMTSFCVLLGDVTINLKAIKHKHDIVKLMFMLGHQINLHLEYHYSNVSLLMSQLHPIKIILIRFPKKICIKESLG